MEQGRVVIKKGLDKQVFLMYKREVDIMAIAQRKKSSTNRQKKFAKEAKKSIYKKDTSISCKEYKHMRRSYYEEYESWN